MFYVVASFSCRVHRSNSKTSYQKYWSWLQEWQLDFSGYLGSLIILSAVPYFQQEIPTELELCTFAPGLMLIDRKASDQPPVLHSSAPRYPLFKKKKINKKHVAKFYCYDNGYTISSICILSFVYDKMNVN